MKDREGSGKKKPSIRLWAVLFWLLLWELAGRLLQMELFLVPPLKVLIRTSELVREKVFWQSAGNSLRRILTGYTAALVLGTVCAAAAARYRTFRELMAPLMLSVKSVPVASFIILLLILFPSRYLAILISFMMALPVIYGSVLEGILMIPDGMLEMAAVFRLPRVRTLCAIWLPFVRPYLLSSAGTAAGLAWKAGIAAEVIGMPVRSIGEHLQQAKVYLDTPDLFSWTLVIVILSLLMERIVLRLLGLLFRWLPVLPLRLRKAAGTAAVPSPSMTSVPTPAGMASDSSTAMIPASAAAPAPAVPVSAAASAPAAPVSASQLSKSFDGKPVLSDISFTIPEGRTSVLMAPSGAGKTTLLRILMGLTEPDSGEIRGMAGRKRSAVFQEDRLLGELNLRDNLLLVNPKLSEDRIRDACMQTGLSAELPSQKPVQEFSGGMQRRTALLRALLAEWDILLLDEPFKGLDEETRACVIRYTRNSVQGRTVLLVTHDPEEARLLGAEEVLHL